MKYITRLQAVSLFCFFLVCRAKLDFLKVTFFPGWLCHFKGLSITFWCEIHRSKILPVTSWYFKPLATQHMSIIFFPAWIYEAKQVDPSTLARPLLDLMHWSSLLLLFRTYERSTCSNSRTKRARHENDHARGWRREKKEGRKKRDYHQTRENGLFE